MIFRLQKPLAEFCNKAKKDKLCRDYNYENVEVHYPRSFYIPLSWSKILLDNRLQSVERTIEKHSLNFDLIHAHFTWPSGYIAVKLKEKCRKPVVITIHENGDWLNEEVRSNNPLIKKAWSNADTLIRVNRKDIPILQEYNERVCMISNGFSPSFHPIDTGIARDQLGISKNIKVIFTLGGLIKRKGFNYLIDAMGEICRRRSDVICLIGGTGREWSKLQRQIDQTHLKDQVKLLGPIPGDKLNLWMNACNLFVLPSLSEGNPTVMFEAFGCGKPFVGTKVGGVPEVIISEDYGLLVEPANPNDLAEKILMALDKEWNQDTIIHFAERYTWDNISRELIEIYNSFMDTNG